MCYSTNIMLKDYYEQLLEVIQGDIELMLSEPDMTKRSPKIILSYLDMAKQCQDSLDSISETDSAGWNSLTFDQQQRINAILSEGETDE
jgi:hypothetical protein